MTLPEHEAVRAALLQSATRAEIEAHAGPDALEKVFAPRHVQIAPGVRNTTDTDLAAMSVAEEIAKLTARRGAMREIADAIEDMSDVADEAVTWRLGQAAEARETAGRGR